ncbi:AbrB/MazE/SpoVT family DNA-binding domain-containing protein [Nocardia macrotermitis]|uniref:AbrB/MazE/SpoVT family DNA-binding domain-containing protein n=1 Tax=Nocardia macrotermitis TaxID=2585198 RepID=UPI001296F61E|nr:AbrB/MazE/SpoVT family DNA-binding domain-containing protein [Nocardia macrotermitis]
MITPIVPPQAPLQELLHGPIAYPVPVRRAQDDLVYGMSTVGEGGRILDRQVFRKLTWKPGTRLNIRCSDHGVLLVAPSKEGAATVTSDELFRVHYKLRRCVNLFIGDRVLLIGRISQRRLVVHPPAAMDELFAESVHLLDRW